MESAANTRSLTASLTTGKRCKTRTAPQGRRTGFSICINREYIVPEAHDGTRQRLSEKVSCEIAGVTPPKRRAWLKSGVPLDNDVDSGLTELQVVELAIVQRLHQLLGPGDARVVWGEVRTTIGECLMLERLELVVDAARREPILVSSSDALVRVAATGRLIRVIPLAPLIKETVEAFRRMTHG